MLHRRKRLAVSAGLTLALLLGGCTYESGVKEFPREPEAGDTVASAQTESAAAWLKQAIENAQTRTEAQKFWYDGYVKNRIAGRTTTSMYDGVVMLPDGYLVNGRIAAQPFQYYRWKDKRYVKRDHFWITAQEEPLPIDVLRGFDDWLPFLDRAVQLREEKIIGTVCVPFQIRLSAAEWLAQSQSPLFEPLRQELAGREDLQQILNDSTVKMTVWIGKEDRLIHQYQTWIILPIPGAGYMDQEVQFRFFKYNDPGIKLPTPEDIEEYLLK